MTEGQAKIYENTVESAISITCEASQKWWQLPWLGLKMRKVHMKEEVESSSQTVHESSNIFPAKERKNIILFTPGNGIKASEEQLQGKRVPFKGQ